MFGVWTRRQCETLVQPGLGINGNIHLTCVANLSLKQELKYILPFSVASIKNLANSSAKKNEALRNVNQLQS